MTVAATVYVRTLQKAAELLGGRAKLCRHLRVPAAELDKWLQGSAKPPLAVFLRAVDVVVDEVPAPGGSDPGEPPAAQDCSGAGNTSAGFY